jgi:hypothetical protein
MATQLNWLGGQTYEVQATHHGALSTDLDTSIVSPQLLWTHFGPAAHTLRPEIRACVQGLDPDPKEPRIHETTRVRTWSRGSGP